MKKIYNYDENGYYKGESNAVIDPMESQAMGEDVYLLPRNSTFDQPLLPQEGKVLRMVNGEWILEDIAIEPDSQEEYLTFEQIKNLKILEIKSNAYIKIVSEYPEWKQRNLNGAVSQVQNKEVIALKAGQGNYTPTSKEMDLLRAAKTCKDFVDAIRAKSNELEASLDSMTEEQLNAFNPSEDSNWE